MLPSTTLRIMNNKFIFSKLHFSYKKRSTFFLTIPYFELYTKEPVRISGTNASGKTTLFKLCSGLLKPISGEILFNGHTIYPIQKYPESIIYVHQNPYIFKGTVLFNIKTVLALYKISGFKADAAIDEIVSSFNIKNILHKKHYELTTGEKQKAALARAFVIKPDVLLLDEPSTGLDAEAKIMLAAAIKQNAANGSSIIFASHDFEFCNYIKPYTITIDAGTLKHL